MQQTLPFPLRQIKAMDQLNTAQAVLHSPSCQTHPAPELATLPNELLLDIAVHLPARDLARLIQTSKRFYHTLADAADSAAAKATCTCSQPPFSRKEKASVLGWAASKGRLSLVDRLLAKGADPRDPWLPSPLTRAAQGGHSAVVARLVSVGAHHGKAFNLIDAVWSGDLETVRVFVDAGFDAKSLHFSSALQKAVSSGNIDITILLLKSAEATGRIKPTMRVAGFELLVSAIRRGDGVMIPLLLESGADPLGICTEREKYGHTPVLVAAQTGNIEILHLLMHAIPDPVDALRARCSVTGRTPLHFAVIEDHADMVEELVRIGAPIDSIDNRGMSPLRCAVAGGNEDTVRTLIMAGANIRELVPRTRRGAPEEHTDEDTTVNGNGTRTSIKSLQKLG